MLKKLRRGLQKIGKKVGKHFKRVGKKLKKGLKKVASKFAELGPLGSIALSFVIPTVGAWIQGLPNGNIIKTIADTVGKVAGKVQNGVGRVFNTVMDGVENGLNGISGKAMTERGWGSSFRDGVSKLTGDFIEGSTKGLDVPAKEGLFKTGDAFDAAKTSGEVDLTQAQASYDRKVARLENRRGKIGEEKFNNKLEALGSRPTDASDFAVTKKPLFSDRDTFSKKQGESTHSIFGKASPATPIDFKGKQGEELNLQKYISTSKEYGIAKRIMPIQASTGAYFRNQEAQDNALEYAKIAQRKYFSDTGQQTLIRPINKNISYLDFSQPLSDTDMFRLQNSYTGIIGEGLYG